MTHLPRAAGDVGGVRSGLCRAYLTVATIGVAGYLLTSTDSWTQVGYRVAIGYLGVAAIIVGVLRYRPAGAIAWWFIAAGVFLNVTGQLAETVVLRVQHKNTFPSIADVFYLGLYPGLIIGMVLLIRRRTLGRDLAATVDASTISIGLGLLSWVFFIEPVRADPSIKLLGSIVSVAYPVFDVLVLAMLIRMTIGAGIRNGSFRLLAGSVLLLLTADTAWAVINQLAWLNPWDWLVHVLDMLFLLAYVMAGAAALHPSIRELAMPAVPRPSQMNARKLGALALASLIAPGLLGFRIVFSHQVQLKDAVAIAIGSTALFLLVVTRLAQLLREVETQARKLRDLTRVDDLTGLPNRRAWTAELPSAIERARIDHAPLTVALLDLDHFKRFNDTYGHIAGDRLLIAATAAWRAGLRDVDQLARYGGEEFIALFPETTGEQAAQVLHRLRAATPAGQTFSAGVATWNGCESSDDLVARADRQLYAAKEAGRDRVLVADVPGEAREEQSATRVPGRTGRAEPAW
jgi:diguanylate cyclase